MKKWLKQLIYIGFKGTEQIEIIQGYIDCKYRVVEELKPSKQGGKHG